MKITYLELPDGDKLISYHRHDFKSKEIDGELYYIDGGQSSGYIRVGGNPDKCKAVNVELEEIFDFIRSDNTYEQNSILDKIKTNEILKVIEIYKHQKDKFALDNHLYYNMLLLEINYRDGLKRDKKK